MHKNDFALARQFAYFDTAAEGLPPCTSEDPFEAYSSAKSDGTPGRARLFAQEAATVRLASQLLKATADRVVLLSSASEGLNQLAASIAWQPGDEVVIDDLEFPSNVVLWLCLRNRGVKMRVVASQDGVLHLEDFVRVLGPRTRLVSVSQVSYKSGTALPFVSDLARAAHDAGAIISVDATQALGRVPVQTDYVDYIVASSYKWLLGPHGLGVVYMSAEMQQRITPSMAGWYSVRDLFAADRFETFTFKEGAARLALGMPNFPSIYALHRGLKYLLACGVEAINVSLAPLVRSIRQGFQERGLQLLTPSDESYASGIVSFSHPKCEEIGAELRRKGVIVWGGDGRIRASVHLYNDSSDVDQLFSALDSTEVRSLL